MSETPTTTTSQKSIAIHLQFVLQYASKCHCALRKGKYFSTPPICIAGRLPFASQYASHLYRNTFRNILVVMGGGVQTSMGNEVPWKTGMLIYLPQRLPVTSRPLISPQKEAVLSPCNFATAHLTACILNFHLPSTSRPMKQRTLSQRPIFVTATAFFITMRNKMITDRHKSFWN